MRAQRDLNPRPTAPQAAILSKLNYGPKAYQVQNLIYVVITTSVYFILQ